MAGANATSADFDAPNGTLLNCLNFLQVRVPGPSGFVVSVTDIVAEAGAFATDFTCFGHCRFTSHWTEASSFSI